MTHFDHQDFDDALVVTPHWVRNPRLLRERLAPILAKACAGSIEPTTFEERKPFMDEMWSDAD